MIRRSFLTSSIVGLTACQTNVVSGAAHSPFIDDDGTRFLAPGIEMRLIGNATEIPINATVAEFPTWKPIRLQPGSGMRVNGIPLMPDPSTDGLQFAGRINKTDRLKIEIIRRPYSHSTFELDVPTFQARPVKVPWTPPAALELELKEARGIDPLAVEDRLFARAMFRESSLHDFLTPEGFKLSEASGIIILPRIDIPYDKRQDSFATKLVIQRTQRLGLPKLTNDFKGGWVRTRVVLPEIDFEVRLQKG